MVYGIKKNANKMLRNKERYSKKERQVLCELVDAVIAEHKNPVVEGFWYLDLVESPKHIEKWELAGNRHCTAVHSYCTTVHPTVVGASAQTTRIRGLATDYYGVLACRLTLRRLSFCKFRGAR